jgi:hypothetical protein
MQVRDIGFTQVPLEWTNAFDGCTFDSVRRPLRIGEEGRARALAHRVGKDVLVAGDEADAAKASLYQHFGCKDQLVASYLERRTVDRRRRRGIRG